VWRQVFYGIVAFFWSIIQLLVLVVYWCGAAQYTNVATNFDRPDPNERGWFIGGFGAFMKALPFVMWYYVGIEELPLASEETLEPKKKHSKVINILHISMYYMYHNYRIFVLFPYHNLLKLLMQQVN